MVKNHSDTKNLLVVDEDGNKVLLAPGEELGSKKKATKKTTKKKELEESEE